MTDWATLRDAYGPAAQVPGLLAAAERDDQAPAWTDLWSRLCHQGTVYSASYAALPILARMAVQRPAAGYVEPLALAAAIVASEDGPEDPAEVLSRYARERNELRDIAERNLALANDFTEFVYALKTLVSFEGVPIWKNQLQALANEELEFECLSCNENLVMDLAEPNATVRSFDDAAVSHTRVLSPDPDRLTGSAARMHALAVSHGQTRVAAQLLHVLGTCVCPQCGDRFLVASALAGADDRS